ncbi:MAG: branched-chain amino acid ABC transporter substrate-binding protein [Actinomycetota bacterium]|nr:branched-chain amino acid ABC transporter substrate-binding protein [Actinomycetota bacterium]
MRSRKNVLRVLAVVAVLMLVATACKKKSTTTPAGTSGSSGPATKIAVTVYGQGAWTGPYNYLVIPSEQGAQLHFKECNADPSFPATVTFKPADTQGDGSQAPPVAQTVVTDPNTVAVVGPAFSGETRAVGDTYNQAQIPFITQSATAVDLAQNGWDYWYRTVGNDDVQGGNDGKFEAQIIKSKKLFISNDTSDYGQPLSLTVKKLAQQGGVQIVGTEGVAATDDYSAFISDVKASGADSLFYGGYDADFAKIVKQAKAAGLNINFMSGDGSVSSTFLSSAGSAAEGTYLSIPANLGGDFVQKYDQEYGSKASVVPVYAAEGYDVAGLICAGISDAVSKGATDPASVRAGIKTYLDSLTTSSPYVGVAKAIAFDPSTHEIAATDINALLYFYQVKGGKLAPLGNASTVLGA